MPHMLLNFMLCVCGTCCGLALAPPAQCADDNAPLPRMELTADDERVELQTCEQKVQFDRNGDGRWQLTTWVRHASAWIPFFDGRRPLIGGSQFDLEPTSYEIEEDTAHRKAVRFRGRHSTLSYDWNCLVELRLDSPLIKFVLTCDLPQGLQLDSPQPTIAFWLPQSAADMTLDQGPSSQTGDVFRVPFNFGFPSAYLWDRQREAVIFFNMTPMHWFSPGGVHRFLDVQVKSQAQGDHLGLGLHARHLSGPTLPPGSMVSEFYLYSRYRPDHPTRFQALDQMIQICAPLHPATSEFPPHTLDGGDVSWETFASRVIRDLMLDGFACLRLTKPWSDTPLSLTPPRTELIVHPDWLPRDASQLATRWNFSTVNHHLAAWMLYARLHPESGAMEFARIKKDALPRFYDASTHMIRSFLPPLPTDNPREISWQSYVFCQEMFQIDAASATEDFNPAVLGRLLMGLEGLISYAHDVEYVFPTYFDPVSHAPLPYLEHPDLGCVREPWTVGSHAYVMMRAGEVTGEQRYRAEAVRSLRALLHSMRYTESNKYYQRTLDHPVEMPSGALTGNAYGAVAAWKIFEATGEREWQQASRDIRNTLLRLTLWHEDQTDAVNRELRHAGLFYPYVGASCTTPWETSEANLCLAWLLGHDTESPLVPLLLKLSNLNRINSFYFYPAVFGPATRALTRSGVRRGAYFPLEPLYQLENMAGSTDAQGTAPYMAGNAIWNWWLYEALAEASDRSILVLNTASLDGYDETLSGVKRELIVFNPTPLRRVFSLRGKHLETGPYMVRFVDPAGAVIREARYTAEEILAGIDLDLDSGEYRRVHLQRDDRGETRQRILLIRATRQRLACVYRQLQDAATDESLPNSEIQRLASEFQLAMAAFARGDHVQAAQTADAITAALARNAN